MPHPKKKVFGLQLPHPSYRFSNVPLALGYLATYLGQSDLAEEVDLQIATSKVNDYMGDTRLLAHIGQIDPDILAFSVYPWNIERTMSLARRVKTLRNESIKIVFGGPEIHSQNPKLMAFSGADYLVTGEGEIPFVEIVRNALFDGQSTPVPSSAFWHGTHYCWHPELANAPALRNLPSPYLSSKIPMDGKMALTLFSYRGCHFRCKYCQWRTASQVRQFPLAQVLAELDFALAANCPLIYISDSAINLSPHFKAICRHLAKARPFNKSIRCFVHLSNLTDTQAHLLSLSGISGVEAGLQSIDPFVNHYIDRRFEKEKFEAGLALLKKYGLRCVIDIIIGLPHANRETIQDTIEYVRELDLDFSLFHLSVSSGCRLYQEKERYNFTLQSSAPYYVLSNHCLKNEDIHKLYQQHLENIADQEGCMDIGYPGPALEIIENQEALEKLETPGGNGPETITDWIIWCTGHEPILIDYVHWARQSASNLSIWFVADRIDSFWQHFFENLVTCLNDFEPHSVVNIYFQTKSIGEQCMRSLNLLNSRLGFRNTFLMNRDHFVAGRCNYLRRDKGHVCLIAPESAWTSAPQPQVKGLKLLALKDKSGISGVDFNDKSCRGHCLDLQPNIGPKDLFALLDSLKEKVTGPHRVYFRHPVIQRLWLQKVWRVCVEPFYRRMLLFKTGVVKCFNYNDYDLALDAILNFNLTRCNINGDGMEFLVQTIQDRLCMKGEQHVSAQSG